jgi:hypothetical protein
MRDISSTRNKGFDMPFNYKSKKRSPKKNAVTRENEIWNIEIIHVDAPTRSLVLIAIDADLRRPLIAAVTSGTAKDIFAKLAGVGRHVGYPKKIWLDFGSEIPPQPLREWAAHHGVSIQGGATWDRRCAQMTIFDDLRMLLHDKRFLEPKELDRDLEEWCRDYGSRHKRIEASAWDDWS